MLRLRVPEINEHARSCTCAPTRPSRPLPCPPTGCLRRPVHGRLGPVPRSAAAARSVELVPGGDLHAVPCPSANCSRWTAAAGGDERPSLDTGHLCREILNPRHTRAPPAESIVFPQVRSSTPSMREANRLTDRPEWSCASPPRKEQASGPRHHIGSAPEAATISCLGAGRRPTMRVRSVTSAVPLREEARRPGERDHAAGPSRVIPSPEAVGQGRERLVEIRSDDAGIEPRHPPATDRRTAHSPVPGRLNEGHPEPFAFQVVVDADFVDRDCFAGPGGSPLAVPARTLLSRLV